MDSPDKTILDSYNFIKGKTDKTFVYAGSYALYLRGITLDRPFGDLDIIFPDITREKMDEIDLDGFTPYIDKLRPLPGQTWEEIDFQGIKLPVLTVKSNLYSKAFLLDFLENRAIVKTRPREERKVKFREDLDYIKRVYGLEPDLTLPDGGGILI